MSRSVQEAHISLNPHPHVCFTKNSLFSYELHGMARTADSSCLATPTNGIWGRG